MPTVLLLFVCLIGLGKFTETLSKGNTEALDQRVLFYKNLENKRKLLSDLVNTSTFTSFR